MSTDRTRKITSSRDAAEAAFKTVTTKPAQLPPKRPIIPNCEMRGNVGLDFLHLAILELNRRRTAKNRDRNLEP